MLLQRRRNALSRPVPCGVASYDRCRCVTGTVIERCRENAARTEGVGDRIHVRRWPTSATSPLPKGASADFVWGEDAWCYVEDKPKLIAEAARLAKPGGTIAFTDWVEGPAGLSDGEAERLLRFMKFPNLQDPDGYATLLRENGCEVVTAQDTGRFAPHVDLYLDMLNKQLTYDALKVIGFDMELMQALGGEMAFMQELAHAGKMAQGVFVARKG